MKEEVVQKLLALNRHFYDAYADDFSLTRRPINPGFEGLLAALPQPCDRLLDVACGNGRFGHYLQENEAIGAYVGVDFSSGLLDIAPSLAQGAFYERNLVEPGCLTGLGQFQAVSFLAALHHIPGWTNRVRLLQEIRDHLTDDGRLLLSTWQFMDSERQRRKVADWAEVMLSAADVEENDYLLTWQRGGFSYRYVCLINEAAVAELAAAAGFSIWGQYRRDGREGNLSLYTILEKT